MKKRGKKLFLNHKIQYLLFLGFILICLNSCDNSYRNLAEKRGQKHEKAGKEILVGVVTSGENAGLFMEGITLAQKEINDNGGIFGREIKLILRNDGSRVDNAQEIAREFAHNTDITAVVGHLQSETALAVSMIYESAGMLFISPGATDPRLTRLKNGKFVFRNIPGDDVILEHVVAHCKQKGFKRFAVIYDRQENTQRQAKIFGELAKSSGIEVVATRSYFRWEEDYRLMASKLISNYTFDAIFLTGELPSAGQVIHQIRELGCDVPFFTMPSLDSPKLGGIIGREAEGTTVPTVFDPALLSKVTREFVNRFETVYDLSPDAMAAQGFDALMLLAHAIRKKGSTVPIVIASVLRFLDDWHGVTGKYEFTVNGDVHGNNIYFKEFRNGRLEYLAQPTAEETIDPSYIIEDISIRIPIKRAVPTIDPGGVVSSESVEIIEQLFEGLTAVDPETYKAIPALAESWTKNADETIYRFKLRDNLKWSNGDTLTAHDVVWSIHRNMAPENQTESAGNLAVIKNATAYMRGELTDPSLVGVHAPADNIVEFELSHRLAYFTSLTGLCAFKPLPRNVIETHKDNWTAPANIISNGPYTLGLWKKGKRLILKKNPLYHNQDDILIPEVHYFVIPDESVGLAMYKNNELDIMGGNYLNIPERSLDEVNRDSGLSGHYASLPQFSTYGICFNMKRPPTDDVRMRKAIASIVDKELIINLVLQTRNTPALTFTHPLAIDSPGSISETKVPFNPDLGRKWLKDAGYDPNTNLPEMDLLCLRTNRDRRLAKGFKLLAAHHLGLRIKIIEADFDEYVRRARSDQAPHMFMLKWTADYPDANNFLKELFHPALLNLPKWKNMEFADLIDQAEITMDSAGRKALYTRADKILCQEVVAVIPVFYGAAHVLVNPRVKGWYFKPFAGQNIKDWRLEK